MSETIALNERGIVLDAAGNIKILSDVDAVAQDVKSRILFNKGENPYDLQDGIAYDSDVFGKFGGEEYLREIFARQIGASDEITDVRDVRFTRNGNALEVSAEVFTIYGVVNV